MVTTGILALLCLTYFSFADCDDEANRKLTDAANCFTLNFYKKMAEGKSNVVSSPFSADVLLSMLYVGSGGTTAQQLSKALGYDGLSVKVIEEAFRSQLSKMRSSNGNTLDLATSIWLQKDFVVKQSFKDAVANYFKSQEYNVDFKDHPHEATSDINNWANKSTRGVIPKIFDEDLDRLTAFVLANAMYFNGTWLNKFETRHTKSGRFLNNDEKESSNTVQFMHQKVNFNYKMDSGLNSQVLEMKYVGGDVSMIVLLPGSGSNIQKLEDSLTCDTFKSGLESLQSTLVNITFPKYEISSDFNLEVPMKAVGIKDVFSNADFSGISSDRRLKVSKAVQKCVVKVNEAGTEAAVVTSMVVGITSVPVEGSVPFVANHPFLYLIVDKRTNIVLFIGRVKEF